MGPPRSRMGCQRAAACREGRGSVSEEPSGGVLGAEVGSQEGFEGASGWSVPAGPG